MSLRIDDPQFAERVRSSFERQNAMQLIQATMPLVEAGCTEIHLPHWTGVEQQLFGFAGASIAGFLLTAIVEFTGAPAVSRQRVQTLLLLWFGGRLSYLLSGVLGILPAAGFDITFLALLSASLAGPLWQQPSRMEAGLAGKLSSQMKGRVG